MNNLDKILEKIEAEGKARIAQIQKETDEKAARLTAETDAVIAGLEAEAAALLKKNAEEIRSRARASAAMKTREILLGEKAALLEEVYAKAEAELLALPEQDYADFLARLAASAVVERVNTVRFLQEEYRDEAFDGELAGEYVLLFSPADRDRVGKAVLASVKEQVASVVKDPPELVLGTETVSIAGGVVVRYGDTETTCSIPVILAGLRDGLDPAVMKLLLDGKGQ